MAIDNTYKALWATGKAFYESYHSYLLLAKDCEDPQAPESYMGTMSTTRSGRTCQAWSEQTPHQHSYGDGPEDFPDNRFPENYCRHTKDWPEGQKPWCYVTDTTWSRNWDYCDVTPCRQSRKSQQNDNCMTE